MRAYTKRKHEIGKRFAIVIGVAAVGVMALGAQTGAQTPAPTPPAQAVVKYDTNLTITREGGEEWVLWHGGLLSGIHATAGSPAVLVRECMEGRKVSLFQKRPGADRKLGSSATGSFGEGLIESGWFSWKVKAPTDGRVYARVKPKVRDRFVCRGDRSRTIENGRITFDPDALAQEVDGWTTT